MSTTGEKNRADPMKGSSQSVVPVVTLVTNPSRRNKGEIIKLVEREGESSMMENLPITLSLQPSQPSLASSSPITPFAPNLGSLSSQLTPEEHTAIYKRANIYALSALAKKGGPNTKDMFTAQQKLQEFLTSLITLAGQKGPQLKVTIQSLVQSLVTGQITEEEFATKIEKDLNSQHQPSLLPFLKSNVPHLKKRLQLQHAIMKELITRAISEKKGAGSSTSSLGATSSAPSIASSNKTTISLGVGSSSSSSFSSPMVSILSSSSRSMTSSGSLSSTRPMATTRLSSSTRPMTSTGLSSSTRPMTSTGLSSSTRPMTSTGLSSSTRPMTSTGLSSSTRPMTSTGLSSSTRPMTSTGLSSSTRPMTSTGLSSSTRPMTSTGLSSSTRPMTSTGLSSSTRPMTSTGLSSSTRPMTSTGLSSSTRPMTSTGLSSSTRPMTSTGLSSSTRPMTSTVSTSSSSEDEEEGMDCLDEVVNLQENSAQILPKTVGDSNASRSCKDVVSLNTIKWKHNVKEILKPASRQGVPEATAFDYFKRLTDLNECRDASSKLKALTKKASPKLSTKQQSGISLPFQVSTGPSQAEETSSQNNDGLTSTISSMCSNLEDSKCLQESSDVSTTSTDDELEETSDDETMTNLVTLSDYFEELEDSDELEETSDDETMTNLVTLSDYFEELEDSDELEETSDDETTTNLATLSVSSEEFEDKYAKNEEGASKILAEEELVEASNEEAMAIILPEMEPSVVYEKLGDGHINSIDSGTDQNVGSTVQFEELRKKDDNLEKIFKDILKVVQESFIENKTKFNKVLPSLKFIEHHEEQFRCLLHDQSWNKLFFTFSDIWDYIHPGLLEFVVEGFGTTIDKNIVKKYKVDLEKYRGNVKLGEFVKIICKRPKLPLFNKELSMHVSEDWRHKTLQDLEDVRLQFADKTKCDHLLLRALPKQSHFTIVFSMPSWVQLNLVDLDPFLSTVGATKVYLNNDYILECVPLKEKPDEKMLGNESVDGMESFQRKRRRFEVTNSVAKKQKKDSFSEANGSKISPLQHCEISRLKRCKGPAKLYCPVCSKKDCGKCVHCLRKPRNKCITYFRQYLKHASQKVPEITAFVNQPESISAKFSTQHKTSTSSSVSQIEGIRIDKDLADIISSLCSNVQDLQGKLNKRSFDPMPENVSHNHGTSNIQSYMKNGDAKITSTEDELKEISDEETTNLLREIHSVSSEEIGNERTNADYFHRKLKESISQLSVNLYITKCGISGPPSTGKTHFRELLLGRRRPSQRQSTALSTSAVEVINADLVSTTKRKSGAFKWTVLEKDPWMRLLANTIYKDLLKKGILKEKWNWSELESTFNGLGDFSKNVLLHLISNVKKNKEGNKSAGEKSALNTLSGRHLLYLVDTGGQPQFHEILPHFLRSSIYFLVHNLSEDLMHCPEFEYTIDDCQYFVPEAMKMSNKSIIEQAARSACSTYHTDVLSKRTPAIAVIGMFKDKCDNVDETLRKKSKEIKEVLMPLTGSKTKCDIVEYSRRDQCIFPFDASEKSWHKNDNILDKLKNKVDKYADGDPSDIKLSYFIFLQNLKKFCKKKPFITIYECENIARSSYVPLENQEMYEALHLFHEVNLILYFRESKEVNDLVFLDPNYLFQMVTDIIVQSFDKPFETNEDFQKSGTFTRELLLNIPRMRVLGGKRDSKFSLDKLLCIMQQLCIISKLPDASYFMPCVLQMENPQNPTPKCTRRLDIIQKRMKKNRVSGPLIISFGDRVLPRGLFCAMVVILSNNYGWQLKTDRKSICRRNLIEFSVDTTESGSSSQDISLASTVIFDKITHIEVLTTCPSDNCFLISQALELALYEACKILKYNPANFGIERGFNCNIGHSSTNHHTVVSKKNKKFVQKCCKNLMGHGKLLEREHLVWFHSNKEYPKEVEIENFCTLVEDLVPNTNQWENIGVRLELTATELDRIRIDYHNEESRFRRVLEIWKKHGSPPYTWNTIIDVLKSPLVKEHVLAEELVTKYYS